MRARWRSLAAAALGATSAPTGGSGARGRRAWARGAASVAAAASASAGPLLQPWVVRPSSSSSSTAGGALVGSACAAGLAALAISGVPGRPPAFAEEDDDGDVVMRPPPAALTAPRDGSRIFFWGIRNAFPFSEASGDALPEADMRSPTEALWFRRHAEATQRRWRQLAFGPSFGAARTDAGELFAWGSCRSKDGKGRIFLEPRPIVLDDLGDAGGAPIFSDVQCSESAIWALTGDGVVIVWERVPASISERAVSSSRPSGLTGGKRVNGLDRPVKDMSVGASHAAFLTEDGRVYCLGSNKCGECGADPAKTAVASSCRLIKFPRHVNPVVRVHCGKSHTVAVGAEGQVLSWGDDSKIQLGLGDTRSNCGDERPWEGSRGYINKVQTGEGMAPPSALRGGPLAPSFSKARPTSSARYGEFEAHAQWKPQLTMDIPLEFERQVHGTPYPPPDGLVGGDDFTILMVRDSPDWFSPEEESNRLFCCGENGKGQCGRSLQTSQQIFSATKLPRNSFTHSVSCGSDHCLAVLQRVGKRKREIWAWGSNEKGQAGGSSAAVACPASRLKLPKDVRVEAAWCGFNTSAVVCSDRPLSRARQEAPAAATAAVAVGGNGGSKSRDE